MPTIAVINQAPNDVSDADLGLWVHAIQRQLLEDVAPFWPLAASANLMLVPNGSTAPAGAWQVVVAPTVEIAGDLGFHETTTFGLPLGKVATQITLNDRQTISRVLSHEIVEMIADPQVTLKTTIGGRTFLVEACDPVHLDSLGFEIDGVLVSNFVTPRYYGLPSPTTDPRNDFRALLNAPCPALPSGGALVTVNGNQLDLMIGPDTAPEETAILAKMAGSRHQQYQMGRDRWRRSEPRTVQVSA